MSVERWNLLHPTQDAAQELRRAMPRRPWQGPVVAATDYMRSFADQIRPHRAAAYVVSRHRRLRPQRLSRGAAQILRGRPHYVAVAALKALADEGSDRQDASRNGRSRNTGSMPGEASTLEDVRRSRAELHEAERRIRAATRVSRTCTDESS